MSSANDLNFLEILKQEKNVTSFLDAFFGFLFRCTDFYVESEPGQKLGFPPGVAENLVRSTFKKWQKQMAPNLHQIPPNLPTSSLTQDESSVPIATQEVEISEEFESEPKAPPIQPSESYNGAVRENYTWCQSISDLDVLINVPGCITSAKDLKVEISGEEVSVSVSTKRLVDSGEDTVSLENFDRESQWTNIFKGKLCFKTRREESIWSLIPGRHVSVHLEKSSERWWESLLVDEPKIELDKIDCSRNFNELEDCEQMKVQELMWNQQQKMLGKPTSEQIKMEQVLKQAWDAEGSPFKGQPYDPSVVKFD